MVIVTGKHGNDICVRCQQKQKKRTDPYSAVSLLKGKEKPICLAKSD